MSARIEWVGIVGHAAEKFTPESERVAKAMIRHLLDRPGVGLVSGRSPMGGVDVWAEEIADELGKPKRIFPPMTHSWSTGYKPRNLQIAEASDEIGVIVVSDLPPDFKGMRFDRCYHCPKGRERHVKSGACWTAKQAEKLGKRAHWLVIPTGRPPEALVQIAETVEAGPAR